MFLQSLLLEPRWLLAIFLVEFYLWGLGGAVAEVPANIAQIAVGGLIGIPIALDLRRRLPEILNF